jgi:hypothetical protein
MVIPQGLTSKLGILVIGMIAGSALSSAAVYAANTVGSPDIIDDSIQSIDIKNAEVKTIDLANGAATNLKIATGAVSLSKLAANSVNSAKIVDGTIQAGDLAPGVGDGDITGVNAGSGLVGGASSGEATLSLAANSVGSGNIVTDAVGADEIAGVSKLIFAECTNSNIISMTAGSSNNFDCSIAGLGTGDNVVATFQGDGCLDLRIGHILTAGQLQIGLKNECTSTVSPGTVLVSVIVYAN